MANGQWPPPDASFVLFRQNLRGYVLVDAAFSGMPSLIKPLTSSEQRQYVADFEGAKFQKLQSSGRMPIEQAWGMVVNRWRVFKTVNQMHSNDWIRRFSTMITAGIVLHNICIIHNDSLPYRHSFKIDSEDRSSPGFVAKTWYQLDPAEKGLSEDHGPEELKEALSKDVTTHAETERGLTPSLLAGVKPQIRLLHWTHLAYGWVPEKKGLFKKMEYLQYFTLEFSLASPRLDA